MTTKYILIQNDGEIETNSFELIGASTKRGDSDKIGFFGSGLKYSIAYMMRKGIDFKVYSGQNELSFSTITETLKGQPFERICINGKQTSYTVTMGPTWKEDWFILREIYCNALDEGNCTLVKETENVQPSEGKTRIFIQLTDALKSVIEKWDAYFTDERVAIFTTNKNTYTCYLANDEAEGFITSQVVSVYNKSEGILFRKGVRVYKNEDYLFDYECNHVNINEDRTAKNPSGLNYAIAHMAAHFANEGWIKTILRTGKDTKPSYEYNSISVNGSDGGASDKWVEFSRSNLLVVEEIASRYAEAMSMSKKEVFLIPSLFARRIKKEYPDVLITGMGNVVGDTFSDEVEMSAKMSFLLKEVIKSLKEMDYDVSFDISVVDFEDDKTLGVADSKNKKILLASKLFDMGRREIAMTLIEEVEHIRSGKEDETRAFQNHLISEWLKSMENSNGLFL